GRRTTGGRLSPPSRRCKGGKFVPRASKCASWPCCITGRSSVSGALTVFTYRGAWAFDWRTRMAHCLSLGGEIDPRCRPLIESRYWIALSGGDPTRGAPQER